jgi:hypothetical protein
MMTVIWASSPARAMRLSTLSFGELFVDDLDFGGSIGGSGAIPDQYSPPLRRWATTTPVSVEERPLAGLLSEQELAFWFRRAPTMSNARWPDVWQSTTDAFAKGVGQCDT